MDISGVIDPTAFISSYSQLNAQQGVMNEVGTALLDKSLDDFKTQGAAMTKMLEQSVAPHIGGNFDFSV